MKSVFKRILLLQFIVMIFAPMMAQNSVEEQIKRRAAERVAQMNDYISFMADKSNDLETRQYNKKQALNLFAGRGYDYEENGIHKEGVRMEVTSVNNTRPRAKLMRVYFNGLVNLTYQKVSIQSTEVSSIKVSNLQKVDNNLYVCTCYFDQVFIGYRDGIPVYKDITRKKVKCYVEVQDAEDGLEYVVLLGDVHAIDTKRIK
ncbi:hypothetical protein [Segatella copri]|uniref:Uncharacterized protein n=1 Tax=Segatella copri TaxID=165179 RepID=A0AAW4MYM1_9BACT|nr:hypothetical protein [Segatella copri]MBV3386446.1 hypothetical protein [Segatella copri]MBV3394782.1 hypothetical protein [Segatella copri]MBV3403618.1 hypothetical protein [Segatella copri]